MESAIEHISKGRLKSIHKLMQKKYRQEEQCFLVEGARLVEEALNSSWTFQTLLVTPEYRSGRDDRGLVRKADELGIEVFEATAYELGAIADTVTSQGIIGIVEERERSIETFWSTLPERCTIVALASIADPGNAGTIIRTCDWFGVHAVLFDKASVEVYNPKVVRSTMGSLFHLPVFTGVDLRWALAEGRKGGMKVFSTLMEGGRSPWELEFSERTIIVLGSEAHGVPFELAALTDEPLTIPRFGAAESLNVAIACGVVLSAVRRGR